MTKKELRWRFKNLPTVQEVIELMANKIITPEEARDLFFNEAHELPKTDEVEALKHQIEFLEGLVKELSKNHTYNPVVYVDRWIKTYPNYPVYYSGIVAQADSTAVSYTSYYQNLIS